MDWFETWFDTPYYHMLYKNHDGREAQDFITKLTAYLQLAPHSEIIDLACGKGRHAVFLNKLGYSVLGLDLSRQSIAYDKQFENENLQFRVHDMRNPIESGPVDAIFNLFTSFGYFDNDEDDRKVFRSVNNALKPGGFFVLDYLNKNSVTKNLTSESTVHRDGIDFHIRKEVQDQYIRKDISFEDGGEQFRFFERVKLHTPEKILAYAEEAGFARRTIWGNYDLSGFDEESSPRCINLFVKK